MSHVQELIRLRKIRQKRIQWCRVCLLCFIILFYLPLFGKLEDFYAVVLVCLINTFLESAFLLANRNYRLLCHWLKWAEANQEYAKRCFHLPMVYRRSYMVNTFAKAAVLNLMVVIIVLWLI